MHKIEMALLIVALSLFLLPGTVLAENEGGTGDSVRVEQRNVPAVADFLHTVHQWFRSLGSTLDSVNEEGTGETADESNNQGTGVNDGGSREAAGGSGKPGAGGGTGGNLSAGNGTGLDFGAGNGTGGS